MQGSTIKQIVRSISVSKTMHWLPTHTVTLQSHSQSLPIYRVLLQFSGSIAIIANVQFLWTWTLLTNTRNLVQSAVILACINIYKLSSRRWLSIKTSSICSLLHTQLPTLPLYTRWLPEGVLDHTVLADTPTTRVVCPRHAKGHQSPLSTYVRRR